MSSHLSKSLNPFYLTVHEMCFKGQVKLSLFKRTSDLLLKNEGFLDYCLIFGVDESRNHYIESEIKTKLLMQCQRCLEPIEIKVHKRTMLGIVKNKEEIGALDKKYEPLFLDEETINIKDIIEDELLLEIPFSPLHSNVECSNNIKYIDKNIKSSPFIALKSITTD